MGLPRPRGAFVDPGRVNLRKAARAALVLPALFALLMSAGNEPAALFGAFGCFAALAFADFGGSLTARLGAYFGLLVLGAGLVALGTALGNTAVPAVVAMLVIGFAVPFAGALGGYWAAGGTAATLAFVLGVMADGPVSELGSRELGWAVGVAVAGIAAVLLWPVHQRNRVRDAAAAVARAVGRALDPARPAAEWPAALDALHGVMATLGARAGVIYRPAGSQARERALVALVVALRRVPPIVEEIEPIDDLSTGGLDLLPEERTLAAVRDSFVAIADVLDGRGPTVLDLTALLAARDTHTAALDRWVTAKLVDGDASEAGGAQAGARVVLARFDHEFPLRRLSLLAGALGAEAAAAVGASLVLPPDAALPRELGTRLATDRGLHGAVAVLTAHWSLRSVRFRNAARAGIGLAAAVLIAKVASLEHAFWAVLGTLTVLRSTALGTGATAVQALSGSVAGFAVASAVMLTIGSDDRVLWVLLPVVVFLSAFTPGAVNFVVGQASFTVFVVVLFNILVPEGWRTGLVRVEDVAIGAGISVVVGALLWPRGARGVASRSFADLIRAERGHLVAAMGGACGRVPGPDVAEARAAAVGARGRAVAALEDLNVEHGGGRVERESWIRILGRATVVQIAGDGIQRAAATYGIASACTAAQGELDGGVERVARALDAEADQLAGTDALAAAPTAPATVATAPGLAECLDAHAHDIEPAMGLVWMHEYLMLVEDALAVNDLVAEGQVAEGQVGETSEDARRG